ncbi:diiron oxygenase [Massilia sp. BJB1822]|uniref:diiron oxygenase n=1 Tax=Massilia sp. BJB1822 TaxID=2744470 RepID=UPI0015939654|nr:diiron oxygenase [Massilia sp. BJB1822]NVD98433.1 diiron oxygenase [Massilia sp. BJB1822]
MNPSLHNINLSAHQHFLHPNHMPWHAVRAEEELDFLSQQVCGRKDEQLRATAYLYKELAQLAEIEFHVASVMVRVIAESQMRGKGELWEGSDLVHALGCFASEEVQHANTFYRYVRTLTGCDYKLENNYFQERITLFQGEHSPLVKLAALCATAYVGESVITVFETRMRNMDPEMKSPFTRLLHLHGLDEARHIRTDHFVIDHVLPSLTPLERRQMEELINATEELNTTLALTSAAQLKRQFGVDFQTQNRSAEVQLAITLAFRRAILAGDSFRKVDDFLDNDTRALLKDFSQSERVHFH